MVITLIIFLHNTRIFSPETCRGITPSLTKEMFDELNYLLSQEFKGKCFSKFEEVAVYIDLNC